MRPQEGLFHPPGAFSALAVWRLSRASEGAQVRQAASRVHAELRAAEGVHAVLAFDAALVSPLAEGEQGAPLLPRRGAHLRIPSTQAQVLLQLGADTQSRLQWALRRAAALFAGVLVPEEEVLGGCLDETCQAPTVEEIRRAAIVPAGPLAGAAWVLYLRFQRDSIRARARALRLRGDLSRARPHAAALRPAPLRGDAPPARHRRAHAPESWPLIRRSFPFHEGPDEGLAFVAASSDPARFRRALDAMLGPGLPPPGAPPYQASAVGGGLYLAPPRPWFSEVTHQPQRQVAP
ncbi:hypothetical protein KRR26_23010 [Corallococcus sp. M34]|uniref:hypothetical protein n=1 Tax=Citreicoccus inhibens TaxID=2849499 RepID=UPI0011C401BE|nr:hypothetical protein [Citreicoccus inhibens]MBU8898484.1 hypothetical protein [Citreicoccus inhibens]